MDGISYVSNLLILTQRERVGLGGILVRPEIGLHFDSDRSFSYTCRPGNSPDNVWNVYGGKLFHRGPDSLSHTSSTASAQGCFEPRFRSSLALKGRTTTT